MWRSLFIRSDCGNHLRYVDFYFSRHRIPRHRDDYNDSAILAKSVRAIRNLEDELRQLQQQATSGKNARPLKPPAPPAAPVRPPQKEKPAIYDPRQEDIDNANAEVETYRMEKAVSLVRAGKYEDAAAIYRKLYGVRELEVKRRRAVGDDRIADNAETSALKIKYEWALVFAKQAKRQDAEDMMASVWARRKQLLGHNAEETRSAQRQLCLIFRSRSSQQKCKEAEKIYRAVWDNQDATKQLTAANAWIMDNGHELAMVLA